MKEIKVPYFKQDTSYTCGPTSMQMVLSYYGRNYSEKELAEKLDTNGDLGTRRTRMREMAVEFGFHCYVDNESTLPVIQFLINMEIPVIVRFLETEANEDHYGVVVGASATHLKIHDPWNGPDQEFLVDEFMNRWTCNLIGDCKQWLMAISPEPITLGHQFHPHE